MKTQVLMKVPKLVREVALSHRQIVVRLDDLTIHPLLHPELHAALMHAPSQKRGALLVVLHQMTRQDEAATAFTRLSPFGHPKAVQVCLVHLVDIPAQGLSTRRTAVDAQATRLTDPGRTQTAGRCGEVIHLKQRRRTNDAHRIHRHCVHVCV